MRLEVGVDGEEICSLSASGHTGFASSGKDIVCAAVSALMQALRLGMERVIEADSFTFSADASKPEMVMEWIPGDDRVQTLARTIVESIKCIAEDHPRYVSVTEFHSSRGKC